MPSLTLDPDDPACRLSINTSISSVSMEESSSSNDDAPPEYGTLVSTPHSLRRFNIQPREDEGQEKLPPYSCALSLENVFMRKAELEGAVYRAHDRNWYRVYATLQGTALTFHKHKGKGVFVKSNARKYEEDPDLPTGSRRGTFLKSYNLTHAEVGIAADYHKRKYVFRIRAETDQFLLSCVNIQTYVKWLQCLFIAIDLAPPLDDRQVPRDLSIPRPRHRTPCIRFSDEGTNNVDIERNTALVREQFELIRRHYPGLSSDPTLLDAPGSGRLSSTGIGDTIAGLEEVGLLGGHATRDPPPRSTSVPNIPPIPNPSLPDLTRAATAPENSSIDCETGKWRPSHRWGAMYDLIYAKRCMAILSSNTPRKSNKVIIRGKEWIVDWSTGTLTRLGPPAYQEIDRQEFDGNSGGTLRVGQYGALIRV